LLLDPAHDILLEFLLRACAIDEEISYTGQHGSNVCLGGVILNAL
jgi:hypothetical protein